MLTARTFARAYESRFAARWRLDGPAIFGALPGRTPGGSRIEVVKATPSVPPAPTGATVATASEDSRR